MKLFHLLIWTALAAVILLFWHYNDYFADAHVNSMLCMGSPDIDQAKKLIGSWDEAGLLPVVRRVTTIDFVFILCYVCILIFFSNRQLRKEPSAILNAMLRANVFFAIATGLLDITENIFLLYNLHHWNDGHYFHVWWLTWLKFILAAWIVAVWLVSVVKSWKTTG